MWGLPKSLVWFILRDASLNASIRSVTVPLDFNILSGHFLSEPGSVPLSFSQMPQLSAEQMIAQQELDVTQCKRLCVFSDFLGRGSLGRICTLGCHWAWSRIDLTDTGQALGSILRRMLQGARSIGALKV